jgi:CDP-diglyceride synthetase
LSGFPEPGTTPASPAGPGPPSSPGAVSGVRVGTGLLLGVVTVLVVLLDALLVGRDAFRAAAPGTGLLLALLSAAAIRELCALLGAAKVESLPAWASLSSFAILAARSLLPALGMRPGDASAFSFAALLLAVLAPPAARIALRPKEGPGSGAAAASAAALRPLAGTALALLLVHVPMALLLELRLAPPVPGMSAAAPSGLVLATMAALACKVGDSAAYFAGRTVGRRPLCWVSPKKTWEGAVAGALAGTAAAAFLGTVFALPLRQGLAFGLVVNLAGQGGDLLESWIKRCSGAKDSGATFGEMGGALDLVDALLLAGPAAFLFHRIVLA